MVVGIRLFHRVAQDDALRRRAKPLHRQGFRDRNLVTRPVCPLAQQERIAIVGLRDGRLERPISRLGRVIRERGRRIAGRHVDRRRCDADIALVDHLGGLLFAVIRRGNRDGVDARILIGMRNRRLFRRLPLRTVAEIIRKDNVLRRGRMLARVRKRDDRRCPGTILLCRIDAHAHFLLLEFVATDVNRAAHARLAVKVCCRRRRTARIGSAGINQHRSE